MAELVETFRGLFFIKLDHITGIRQRLIMFTLWEYKIKSVRKKTVPICQMSTQVIVVDVGAEGIVWHWLI